MVTSKNQFHFHQSELYLSWFLLDRREIIMREHISNLKEMRYIIIYHNHEIEFEGRFHTNVLNDHLQ